MAFKSKKSSAAAKVRERKRMIDSEQHSTRPQTRNPKSKCRRMKNGRTYNDHQQQLQDTQAQQEVSTQQFSSNTGSTRTHNTSSATRMPQLGDENDINGQVRPRRPCHEDLEMYLTEAELDEYFFCN